MSRGQAIWMLLLLLALVVSGVSVAYAKFQSRALFVELQQMRAERDRADAEWGRLQLEVAAQGSLGRVTRIADRRLKMRVPRPEQIVVVR